MLHLLGRRRAGGNRHGGGSHHLLLSEVCRTFARRREGMCFALDGGVWLHRHRFYGEPMVHLVSADRDRLLAVGEVLGMKPRWLQDKPLKDPRTGVRVAAWHWDVWGAFLQRLEDEVRRC